MKNFVDPEVQILKFEVEDVITDSEGNTDSEFVPGANEGGGY